MLIIIAMFLSRKLKQRIQKEEWVGGKHEEPRLGHTEFEVLSEPLRKDVLQANIGVCSKDLRSVRI